MAHEISTTLKINGKWMNFKTVFGGKRLSDSQVKKMFLSGNLKPLGGGTFSTAKKAEMAAEKRSALQRVQ